MSGWSGFIKGMDSMKPHVENARLSQLSSQYNKLSTRLSSAQGDVSKLSTDLDSIQNIYENLASIDRAMHCESASLEENAKSKIIKTCAILCDFCLSEFNKKIQEQHKATISMIRDYNFLAILCFFIAHRETLSFHNRALLTRHIMGKSPITSEQINTLTPETLKQLIQPSTNAIKSMIAFNDLGIINKEYAPYSFKELLDKAKSTSIGQLERFGAINSMYDMDYQTLPNANAVQVIADSFNFMKDIDNKFLEGFKGIYPVVDIGNDLSGSDFFHQTKTEPKPKQGNFFQMLMSYMLAYIDSNGKLKMPKGSEFRMLMKKV